MLIVHLVSDYPIDQRTETYDQSIDSFSFVPFPSTGSRHPISSPSLTYSVVLCWAAGFVKWPFKSQFYVALKVTFYPPAIYSDITATCLKYITSAKLKFAYSVLTLKKYLKKKQQIKQGVWDMLNISQKF